MFCRWCLKSEWLSSVPTQTASFWTEYLSGLYWRQTLLFFFFLCFFYFVIWKKKYVIPLVCDTEFMMQKSRIVVVWCIAVFLCAFKGHGRRCNSTFTDVRPRYCTAVATGLLCCFPLRGSQFTLISQGDEVEWFAGRFNRLSSKLDHFSWQALPPCPSFINQPPYSVSCVGHCVANACLFQPITERKKNKKNILYRNWWPDMTLNN